MIERGFLKTKKTVLTVLVTREQAEQYDSEDIIAIRFKGSLPKFVTAFIGKKLTQDKINELKRLLDEYKEE